MKRITFKFNKVQHSLSYDEGMIKHVWDDKTLGISNFKETTEHGEATQIKKIKKKDYVFYLYKMKDDGKFIGFAVYLDENGNETIRGRILFRKSKLSKLEGDYIFFVDAWSYVDSVAVKNGLSLEFDQKKNNTGSYKLNDEYRKIQRLSVTPEQSKQMKEEAETVPDTSEYPEIPSLKDVIEGYKKPLMYGAGILLLIIILIFKRK